MRSGSALIKGLSGLTGVVDIKTRKPERESFSAMFRYGEQNSYTSHLRYGNVAGDLAYQVSASFFGTGGPPGLGGKERIANLYGALDWNISSDLHLQTGITYLGGMREFVRIADQPSSSPNILNRQEKFDPIRTLLTYAKLNVHGTNGSLTELQTNLSYRKTDFNNYLISEELTTINAEDDYEFSINLLHNRPLGTAHTLRAGVLYHHWAAPEGKRFYAGNRGDIHTWSGVVASEHQAGRFLFDAGLRIIGGYISEWGGFGIEGGAAGLQNIEPIKNETVPLEWQSVLGSTWLLPGPYSLHYTISAGTLAPRTGSLNSEFERPDYEARFQHDLGLLYRSPDLNEFSFTAFYAQRRNALELSGEIEAADAYYVELFQNLDKRTYGVELSGRWNIPWLHSRFFANATLMRGENEIDGDMVKDEKLPNLIINSGILFDYRQWDFNLFIHHTGPYVNNRFVRGPWIAQNGDYPLGDYLSIDLTTGYTFYVGNFSARIFGEVKNLLDERYETVAGYPDPGRLIHGGFRLDL